MFLNLAFENSVGCSLVWVLSRLNYLGCKQVSYTRYEKFIHLRTRCSFKTISGRHSDSLYSAISLSFAIEKKGNRKTLALCLLENNVTLSSSVLDLLHA